MTSENGESRKSPPRWLYGVLIASLAANLLVAGGAVGAIWAHRHGHGERGLIGFADRLPAERQGTIRDGLTSEREKLKPLREAVKTSWTETNAVLGEEPFDKEKFKASLGRMNEAELRVRTAVTGRACGTRGQTHAGGAPVAPGMAGAQGAWLAQAALAARGRQGRGVRRPESRSFSASKPYSVPGMGEKVPLGCAREVNRDAPVAFRRLALLEPGAAEQSQRAR